tara:strand:+ start:911 stop:1114 length:204 start_codon:yes stop_codon:yes gene_type:complete
MPVSKPDCNNLTDCGSSVNETFDHHSGYYEIQNGLEITIEEFKQMTNWGGLIVDGILNVDGQLIIEA